VGDGELKESLANRWRYGYLYPLVGRLPRPIAYDIVYRTKGAGGFVDRHDKAVMRRNLISVFGGKFNPDPVIEAHFAMRALENLDPYYLDCIPSRYTVYDFMEFRNWSDFEEAYALGKGVVLLIGHYGRVTMPFVGLGNLGYRVGGVTMSIQTNPHLGNCEKRHIQFKSDCIERHAGGIFARVGNVAQLKTLLRLLRQGGIAYLAVDVFERKKDDISLPFLQGKARFPASILKLASYNSSAVVGCFAHQEGKKLVVEFERAPTPARFDDYEILAKYVGILEHHILNRPQEWWFWPILHLIWEPI
jgi:lauroyl/myristoyl acyltransferase